MSRFVERTKRKNPRKIANFEGAESYSLDAEMELYATVVTCALQKKFYESSGQTVTRIRGLIKQVRPEFVAQLAVYAREQMYMRSIPLVLVVELAKIHSGDDLVSRMVARVVKRADEITELLGYYALANKRKGQKRLGKVSNQILHGLAMAFNNFDEYQFAKYNRDGDITLKDALFLAHPCPKSENQQKIFNKIVAGNLATPYTWETELSKPGRDKAQVWQELLDSGKLGYMALLRNLRNILQAKVAKPYIGKAADAISDERAVLRSKQFPFRFFSAYRELEGTGSTSSAVILDALEEAMDHSAANIAGFDRNTDILICTDFSGSMQHAISDKSKIKLFEVGGTLAMLLHSRCRSVINSIFGASFKVVQLPTRGGILGNISRLRNMLGVVGHSTNGWKAIRYLRDKNMPVDKVMIFTDLQLWDDSAYGTRGHTIANEWKEYKNTVAPNAKLYLFDLAGYGNTPVDLKSGLDAYLIAGWSDKIFDILARLEDGQDTLSAIRSVEV